MSTAGMIKYILAILFVSVFIEDSLANDTVSIFQFNGALQCHESNIVTPDMAAQQLEQAGLKILGKSSKKVPYGIQKKCRAPTGEANVFVVHVACQEGLRHKIVRYRDYGDNNYSVPIATIYSSLI